MVRGDQGRIFIGTRGIGRVYEVTDRGNERSSRVVVDKLNQPARVEFRNASLYGMAIDKMLRFDGIESNPNATPVDMTATFQLPPLQHHNWKYIRFGPDGNSVGFDWHPVTRELWFTDHGRDWMGDNSPADELNRMSSTGQNFGFPYCHANGAVDRDIKKDRPCDGVTLPVTELGPHVAALGLMFYTGNMFPAAYRNQMLVMRKGSWNRSQKSGFDVVRVSADADGKNASDREQIPRLAGQREDYLLQSLRMFTTGQTAGRDTLMSNALHGLSDADLVDMAHYLAHYKVSQQARQ